VDHGGVRRTGDPKVKLPQFSIATKLYAIFALLATVETASEVERVGEATTATRESAGTVESVAGDLGEVAARLRGQVDQFFAKLNAAQVYFRLCMIFVRKPVPTFRDHALLPLVHPGGGALDHALRKRCEAGDQRLDVRAG
jgi:hypothetical protein